MALGPYYSNEINFDTRMFRPNSASESLSKTVRVTLPGLEVTLRNRPSPPIQADERVIQRNAPCSKTVSHRTTNSWQHNRNFFAQGPLRSDFVFCTRKILQLSVRNTELFFASVDVKISPTGIVPRFD